MEILSDADGRYGFGWGHGASVQPHFRFEPFDAEHLEAAANAWLAESGLELKKVGQAIRVSLTGRAVSPPLYDTMEILGREKTIARLRAAPGQAAAAPENP